MVLGQCGEGRERKEEWKIIFSFFTRYMLEKDKLIQEITDAYVFQMSLGFLSLWRKMCFIVVSDTHYILLVESQDFWDLFYIGATKVGFNGTIWHCSCTSRWQKSVLLRNLNLVILKQKLKFTLKNLSTSTEAIPQ